MGEELSVTVGLCSGGGLSCERVYWWSSGSGCAGIWIMDVVSIEALLLVALGGDSRRLSGLVGWWTAWCCCGGWVVELVPTTLVVTVALEVDGWGLSVSSWWSWCKLGCGRTAFFV